MTYLPQDQNHINIEGINCVKKQLQAKKNKINILHTEYMKINEEN